MTSPGGGDTTVTLSAAISTTSSTTTLPLIIVGPRDGSVPAEGSTAGPGDAAVIENAVDVGAFDADGDQVLAQDAEARDAGLSTFVHGLVSYSGVVTKVGTITLVVEELSAVLDDAGGCGATTRTNGMGIKISPTSLPYAYSFSFPESGPSGCSARTYVVQAFQLASGSSVASGTQTCTASVGNDVPCDVAIAQVAPATDSGTSPSPDGS